MIDLNELIETATRNRDSGALSAYNSVMKRADRRMDMPGPRKGAPLSQNELVKLVREEIKERQESNEYIRPSDTAYATNQYIISVLSKIQP
ncbi:MAG: hypothetical protein O6934_00280 [SAR324 cluster bacterium]|nr:hypothetical protein [SAR324 cluster bacterium]